VVLNKDWTVASTAARWPVETFGVVALRRRGRRRRCRRPRRRRRRRSLTTQIYQHRWIEPSLTSTTSGLVLNFTFPPTFR